VGRCAGGVVDASAGNIALAVVAGDVTLLGLVADFLPAGATFGALATGVFLAVIALGAAFFAASSAAFSSAVRTVSLTLVGPDFGSSAWLSLLVFDTSLNSVFGLVCVTRPDETLGAGAGLAAAGRLGGAILVSRVFFTWTPLVTGLVGRTDTLGVALAELTAEPMLILLIRSTGRCSWVLLAAISVAAIVFRLSAVRETARTE